MQGCCRRCRHRIRFNFLDLPKAKETGDLYGEPTPDTLPQTNTYGIDQIVVQDQPEQVPPLREGPVQAGDVVVLREQAVQRRVGLQVFGQPPQVVVGEVQHLQVGRLGRQLGVQVGQLVRVDEEPRQLLQVDEGAVQAPDVVASHVEAVHDGRYAVAFHVGDQVAGKDQGLQVLQVLERRCGELDLFYNVALQFFTSSMLNLSLCSGSLFL